MLKWRTLFTLIQFTCIVLFRLYCKDINEHLMSLELKSTFTSECSFWIKKKKKHMILINTSKQTYFDILSWFFALFECRYVHACRLGYFECPSCIFFSIFFLLVFFLYLTVFVFCDTLPTHASAAWVFFISTVRRLLKYPELFFFVKM